MNVGKFSLATWHGREKDPVTTTNPHSLGKSGKMAPKIPWKAVGFRRPPRRFGVFDFFDLPKL
jgi:hypothetical protein